MAARSTRPNLDRLAQQGTRFTEFYVGSTCSPTRSMLLTGIDNHRTGLGNMYERTAPNQLGRIGYEGILSTQVPTVADRLKAQGYRTYMAGKWHLGHSPAHVPHARGFDRSFTMLAGGGSHFDGRARTFRTPFWSSTRTAATSRSCPRTTIPPAPSPTR